MTFKPAFEIITTKLGDLSIRDNEGGEVIHSAVGPWKEAQDLYINQSRLTEKLMRKEESPLVVYDVGLGAGFNAAATLQTFYSLKPDERRPLTLISFEKNLKLLDFTLSHIECFPDLKPFSSSLRNILDNGIHVEDGLEWRLVENFLDPKIELPLSNIAYFDPYSPKANPEMWTVDAFKMLRKMSDPQSSIVITYSAATPVRVGLLIAGFFVSAGKPTGLKWETTFASSKLEDLENPLGDRWLRRWERSSQSVPYGGHGMTKDDVSESLRWHPQFVETFKNLHSSQKSKKI